jgi:hypothetical protein
MAKKRGRGRPKLPKGKRQLAVMTVRMSLADRKEIESAVDASGGKASEWIRMTLLAAARTITIKQRRAEELNPDADQSVPRLVKGL